MKIITEDGWDVARSIVGLCAVLGTLGAGLSLIAGALSAVQRTWIGLSVGLVAIMALVLWSSS